MAKKQQRAATCIYCGSTGVTKEHIISDWISKEFDDGKTEYYINPYKENPENPNQYVFAPTKVKQGKIGQITLRRVCEQCNCGWMKNIVDESVPIVKALVKKSKFTLSIEDKQKISSWVVLSCIHYDVYLSFSRPENMRSIVQYDLDFISTNGFPSKKFEVWIGRSSDIEFGKNIWGQPCCLRYPGSSDTTDNYIDFTMSIRGVIFFVRYNNTNLPHMPYFTHVQHKFNQVWPNPDDATEYPNGYEMNQFEANIFFDIMNKPRQRVTQYGDPLDLLLSMFRIKIN